MSNQTERERAEMARADAEPEVKVADLIPIGRGRGESWLKILHQEQEATRERRASTCPKCASLASPEAQECPAKGSDVPVDDVPTCRWASEAKRESDERRETAVRRERLEWAGYRKPSLLKMISEARTPPVPAGRVLDPGFVSMWAAVRRFEREPSFILLGLLSDAGAGKSHAAAWLAAATPGTVVVRPDDVRPCAEWDERAARARGASLLIVEEAGLFRFTGDGWVPILEIEKLICRRYDEGLRSVIVGNLTGAAFKAQLGQRVASRVADKECSDLIWCGYDDLRSPPQTRTQPEHVPGEKWG